LFWPENPWLLNSRATALFELGQLDRAHEVIIQAAAAVETVTPAEWIKAYPGNDPLIAIDGVAAFKKAVAENMHSISEKRDAEQKVVQ
jgi:hypothetical protein